MNNLRELEEKREYCLQEIARRTPPMSHHEVAMIYAFRRLLDDIESRLQIAEMSSTDA